jgi:hypothetical protein
MNPPIFSVRARAMRGHRFGLDRIGACSMAKFPLAGPKKTPTHPAVPDEAQLAAEIDLAFPYSGGARKKNWTWHPQKQRPIGRQPTRLFHSGGVPARGDGARYRLVCRSQK